MDYHILTDEHVHKLVTMRDAVTVMQAVFRTMANDKLVAPPRFRLDAPLGNGALVFTAGATPQALGFRVYDTFPSPSGTEQVQLVAVFDGNTGNFRGAIVGSAIGAMRTAAIGGVAIDQMARQDAQTLVIIGAGFQARQQVQAALAVRDFEQVILYSRTRSSAEKLQTFIKRRFTVACEVVDSAEIATRQADVLICATNSRHPVFETAWIKAGTHISSIGPKARAGHELPDDIDTICTSVATDSLAQLNGYDHFLQGRVTIVGLDQIVAGKQIGRITDNAITLFCSVGLAGTEVMLADLVLQKYADLGD